METWSDICPFKKEELFAALLLSCFFPFLFLQGTPAWWHSLYRNEKQEWQATNEACKSCKQGGASSAIPQASL